LTGFAPLQKPSQTVKGERATPDRHQGQSNPKMGRTGGLEEARKSGV
jgi:hypothetical protein